MPSTMQQSMVKNRAMIRWLPAMRMMKEMIWEARPVMAMQPATQPATPQAAMMEMQLLPPLAMASMKTPGFILAPLKRVPPAVARSPSTTRMVSTMAGRLAKEGRKM